MSETYGVIGVGSIAAAVVVGLCDGDAPRVVLSPRSAVTSSELAARFPSVAVAADNQGVVDEATIVLLCIRPGDAETVLAELEFRPEQVVVSVLAGVPLADVTRLVAPAARVARVMPLPSVAQRAGVTPVHPPLPEVVAIFDGLGGVVPVEDERVFDAMTVPAATIGAHFTFLGTVAHWLADQGIADEDARRYVAAVYAGLRGQLGETPDFDALVREVATPGGLNEQFARHMREAGAAGQVRAGLDGVLERLVVAEN